MAHFFRFADPQLLWVTFALLGIALLLRRYLYKPVMYRYTLSHFIKMSHSAVTIPHKTILAVMRVAIFTLLALLIAKPQIVDEHSQIIVDGISIMLVLDVSGSMDLSYGAHDSRTRFSVAREEAINFSEKRLNDALGLVIFGKNAITRVPLTADKHMLKSMIQEVQLGDIDYNGTVIATAIITALNRLKNDRAKSKIMILLTDGTPTPEDSDAAAAIAIAQKMGVKIYTIGIGSTEQAVYMDPRYGLIMNQPVNQPLLEHIAQKTGGKFFMAHNADDMRSIYNMIDQLEKTKHTEPLFSRYYDLFPIFVVIILGLLLFEVGITSWGWFGL